ncbi:DUF559 domain-containing protein [Agromyces sp. MMS24-K17]|uniref:DUF559 domain-containing protein n=1 Tax=Agromyces sp. MMS24-K17 TaxID=3372850 RepID=UPI0037545CA1
MIAPAAVPRGRGVIGHRTTPGRVIPVSIFGLPTVSPEDAWCQLAGTLGVRELVVAADSLLRRQAPISDREALAAAMERHAGCRGHRRLGAAFGLARPGTDSVPETELRLDLIAHGLPEPAVNATILDRHGRRIAIGDLVYARYRVLVEYDGEQHRTDDRQFGRDVNRLDDLARAGWRVIRFTKQHRGRARIGRIARVREALVEAGWRPGNAA